MSQDISKIVLVISQPAVTSAPSEWSYDAMGDAHEFSLGYVRMCGEKSLGLIGAPLEAIAENLTPGEKQCQYCKAKADCPALRGVVAEAAFGEAKALEEGAPAVLQTVAASPSQYERFIGILPLVSLWVDAVKDRIYTAVKNGEIPAFKLVPGKRGRRKWADEKQAEDLMKSFRLKREEMYDFSVISPTTAEKVLADNPRKWTKLAALIVQDEGKPVIAPVDDPRQAVYTAPTAGFESVENPADDLIGDVPENSAPQQSSEAGGDDLI